MLDLHMDNMGLNAAIFVAGACVGILISIFFSLCKD